MMDTCFLQFAFKSSILITLNESIRTLPSDYFRPHMGALQKTLSWIEAHQVVEVVPNYCDPVSLKCYGKSLK